MPYRRIECTIEEYRAAVCLPAPCGRCSLDEETADELHECMARLRSLDNIRVVTITGRGSQFAVGRRIAPEDVSSAPIPRRLDWIARMAVANALAALPMPTVAILNGDATGHGLEFAMAADLRVAVDTATFTMGNLTECGFPFDGGTQRLPALVGPAMARDMLLTGRTLSATEALKAGLVNRVVSKKRLPEAAREIAEQIVAAAPIASRYAKEAVHAAGNLTLCDGLRLEADLSVILQSTQDRSEGLLSFAEKRTPKFQGR